MKWKISNVELDNQVCLAPMAGISNSAYRRIAKHFGCGLVFAEMVSDKALVYENEKTREMLFFTEMERPIVQQIFGSDKDSFVEAAKIVYDEMRPDIIDINMGCPVPKVALRSQAGASLLKHPDKIYSIVKSVAEAVPCPVTVKIRSGWDQNSINAVEVAKICERAGASAITIHPRTRSQGYSGKSDWHIIKEVKDNVKIPVIGNGDIKRPEDAKKMLDETGCDAIMIGRALLGNPWLIRDTIHYLDTGEKLELPTKEEKIEMCLQHFKYLLGIKSEKQVVFEMRGHAAWYIRGLPQSNIIKDAIFKANTKEEFKKILNDYLKQEK